LQVRIESLKCPDGDRLPLREDEGPPMIGPEVLNAAGTGDKMHGQLTISKDDHTWTAILSKDLTWSCDDDYLRGYLSQLSVLYSGPIIRRTMQAAKRDLEYGGYVVGLVQSHHSIVSDIVNENREIRRFWSNAHGWAPMEAAELLAKSRLDRQVSLSGCLRLWLERPTGDDRDGRLILAWVNLGSLVEGTLKFFLSVYESNYSEAPRTRGQQKRPCEIDDLRLEEMKQFFNEHVWTDPQKHWNDWLGKIQCRRNAVHAHRDRDIGTFEDFFAEMATYLDFLMELEGQVPKP
jgi:hypothetical protein